MNTRTWRHSALAAAALAAMQTPAWAVDYSWTSGAFVNGVTAPSPLAAGDVLNIDAGGIKRFSGAGASFNNSGTVNWNADTLYFESGAALVNDGLWNASSDQSFIYNGGSAPSFTNNGVFRKSGGSGSTTINNNVGFVNNGTLDAASGTLSFVGGTVFNAGSVFTGAGSVSASSGSNSFNGAFTSSNLVLAGGTHLGNAAVLGGTVSFSGGAISGTWTVAAGQTLNGDSGGLKRLSGTVLTNDGTFAWNSGEALYLESSAVLRNQGLFVANQNMSLLYNGGAAPAVQNTGTLRAAAGVTLNVGNTMGFVNDGGTLDALAGGAIRYTGGATFNAGTLFSGAGSNVAAGSNRFNGSFTSANLVLESGVHDGGNALINGNVAWTGGFITGSWTLAAGQTLQGSAGGLKVLEGGATQFTNQGTVSWATASPLYLQSGAVLRNEALFIANADTAITYNGGSTPSFLNLASGTVRAAAGKTLTIGNLAGFVNQGGRLDAEAGAAIVYASGSRFESGTRFTGAGSNVAAGNNTWAGAFDSGNLVLQSGTHTGSAAVLQGSVAWTGGTLQGGWTVAAGQTLRAADGGLKVAIGAVLDNQGLIDWATANPLYLQSAAQLNNQGLFLASTSTQLLYNGGAQPQFLNTGTVRAAAGQTLAIGNLAGFVNQGGTLDALAGASIVYGGGTQFNAGTQFSGAGSNVAAGNNVWSGGFHSANLVLQSGVHTGTGAVIGGSAAWRGGSLQGSWTVGAGQSLQGRDGGIKTLESAALVNLGSIAWQTANPLYLQSGASFVNAGTLDFSADGAIVYNGGSAPSVTNTGLIVKSGGSGTTMIGNTLNFDNLGTIDVQSGSIALPNNFTNHGRLQGIGSYSVSGALFNEGTLAPGASPGTLALSGSYTQAAGGVFEVDLAALTSHDLFNVSGSAALGGTLALHCWGACSLAVGDTVTILDAAAELSGTFANITLSGFGSGAFSVVYDLAADRVLLQVTQTVSAVPEPGTLALWLAGIAVLGSLARRRLLVA